MGICAHLLSLAEAVAGAPSVRSLSSRIRKTLKSGPVIGTRTYRDFPWICSHDKRVPHQASDLAP
jgi:hypothetical protein